MGLGVADAVALIETLRARLDAEQVAVTFDVPGAGPMTLTVGRGGLQSIENAEGATLLPGG
jgi:hypothetical protein